MKSWFADPERKSPADMQKEQLLIHSQGLVSELLQVVDGLLAVLNDKRQIVVLNDQLMTHLGIKDPSRVLGMRLGEVIKCVYSREEESGCGTSKFCATCGAAIAMVTALAEDKPVEKNCAVTIQIAPGKTEDLFFRVHAKPVRISGQRFQLLFLQFSFL